MLSALKDFYHGEGEGVRDEDLKTDTYNVRSLKMVASNPSLPMFLNDFLCEMIRIWEA